MDLTTYKGVTYTQAQLDAAFDRVRNSDDWRAEIDATLDITDAERDVITFAIIFFTGTSPLVARELDGIRFMSEGYRMGPCGP